jgi:hypothetical protein
VLSIELTTSLVFCRLPPGNVHAGAAARLVGLLGAVLA